MLLKFHTVSSHWFFFASLCFFLYAVKKTSRLYGDIKNGPWIKRKSSLSNGIWSLWACFFCNNSAVLVPLSAIRIYNDYRVPAIGSSEIWLYPCGFFFQYFKGLKTTIFNKANKFTEKHSKKNFGDSHPNNRSNFKMLTEPPWQANPTGFRLQCIATASENAD